jgi:hypothetical protein
MRIQLLLLFLAFQLQSFSQTTYVWVGANRADFGVASNWSPARTTALVTDILHFRNNVGGDTLLITNYGWGVNSQSNAAQMWVESGKSIIFEGQTFPNQMYGALLALYGGDGPVLVVDSNAHFGLYTPEISFYTFNPRTFDVNPTAKSEVLINGTISVKSHSTISPGNIYFKNSDITLNGTMNLLSTTQFVNGNFQGVFIANQPGYTYFGNPNYNSKLKVFGRINYIGGGDQFVNACDSCIEYRNGSKLILNYSDSLSRNNFTGHFFEGSEIQVLSLPSDQTHLIQFPDSISHLKINYNNNNAPLRIVSASTNYNYLRKDVLIKGNVQIAQTGNSFVQFNLGDNYDVTIHGNLNIDGGRLKVINQGLSYQTTRSRLFLLGNFQQTSGELFFDGIAQRFGLVFVKGNFFSNNGFIKNLGQSVNSRIEFNGNNTQTLNFNNPVDDSLQFIFNNPAGYVLVNNLNIGEQSLVEIHKGSFSGNGRIDYFGFSSLSFKNQTGIYQTNNKILSPFSTPAILTIDGAGGIQLHATKKISHSLNLLNGKVYLNNSDTLYLGSSLTGSGQIQFNSSSYIIGKFSRWISSGMGIYDFPIGSNVADRRVQISYTTANANGAFLTSQFLNAQPGVLGLPLYQTSITINKTGTEGYWRIHSANGFVTGNYNIHVLAKQFGGIQNISNLVLIRREMNGSPFQLLGTHISGTGSIDSVVLGRSNLNVYGDFALGGDLTQNPLPVELLSFSGNYNQTNLSADLKWISASEINVFKYVVERSFDNEIWSMQGEIFAKGNSSKNTFYSFNDDFNTNLNFAYYRLKMLDLDGSFEYSKTILVRSENNSDFVLYPNPTNGESVELGENTQIEITDLSGRKIYEGFTNRIDVSSFTKGVYLVKTPFGTERLLVQ